MSKAFKLLDTSFDPNDQNFITVFGFILRRPQSKMVLSLIIQGSLFVIYIISLNKTI